MGEQIFQTSEVPIGEDTVDQMLVLAERIRASNGGEMDESAIQAVAEATGAPVEYVRLAIRLRSEKKEERPSFLAGMRNQFLTLEPTTRRYVTTATLASGCALLIDLEEGFQPNRYGIFQMLALALACVSLYYIGASRDRRTAALSGAIFGGGLFFMHHLFGFLLQMRMDSEPSFILVASGVGAVVGVLLNRIVDLNRGRLGLKDPVEDRQEMLRQLHRLRDRLHSGEQSLTFLSVDIVGSRKLKQLAADPLSVEFTFNEYHHFVERVTQRHGGRVHSTAGDGVISAFETPAQAFAAAKHVQTELFELNTFRNRIGSPIVLRCGVHSGTVVAPDASDLSSLNFADVIDGAAHLQKLAPPGGIVVSELTARQLPGGTAAVGAGWVDVHDLRGVVWPPKNTLSVGIRSSSPSLPHQA